MFVAVHVDAKDSPECHFTDTVHIVIFGAHLLDLASWLLRPKVRPIFTSLALGLQ